VFQTASHRRQPASGAERRGRRAAIRGLTSTRRACELVDVAQQPVDGLHRAPLHLNGAASLRSPPPISVSDPHHTTEIFNQPYTHPSNTRINLAGSPWDLLQVPTRGGQRRVRHRRGGGSSYLRERARGREQSHASHGDNGGGDKLTCAAGPALSRGHHCPVPLPLHLETLHRAHQHFLNPVAAIKPNHIKRG